MNTILIITIMILALLAAIRLFKVQPRAEDFSYQTSPSLLTKAERSFYGVLVQAVQNEGLIFAKVRVADILKPQGGLSRSQWQRAFNAISSKHFDFVICNPDDTSIMLVIELDDSSHREKTREKRDLLIDKACKISGLPLLRIKAAKGYGVEDIKNQIKQTLFPEFQEPTETSLYDIKNQTPICISNDQSVQVPLIVTSQNVGEENEILDDTSLKPCSKCGSEMVLRQAKTGKNTGQKFWGCSRFPECRNIIKID